ncbi:hypothetical protein JTE90_023761 [Oedothorax gibbosus]|uniref:Uncharacterized protein n=1 Tax=Oedothorax gibbosus TaxID=931172 RepID=A0AAV6TTP9_9ARAC|nr:hypothetical protein JTE90_023761 [Oedothorax gibbosus]
MCEPWSWHMKMKLNKGSLWEVDGSALFQDVLRTIRPKVLISHVSSILRTEGKPGFVQSIVGILHQA